MAVLFSSSDSEEPESDSESAGRPFCSGFDAGREGRLVWPVFETVEVVVEPRPVSCYCIVKGTRKFIRHTHLLH